MASAQTANRVAGRDVQPAAATNTSTAATPASGHHTRRNGSEATATTAIATKSHVRVRGGHVRSDARPPMTWTATATAAPIALQSAIATPPRISAQALLAMVENHIVRELVLGHGDATETIRVLAELWWRAVYSRADDVAASVASAAEEAPAPSSLAAPAS